MNYQLSESLDRLVQLFASARERERSDEALNAWTQARAGMDALCKRQDNSPQLKQLDACLASLESVVRTWSISGFQVSFRLAGLILESALIDQGRVDHLVEQAA